jgi:hypothetical protein
MKKAKIMLLAIAVIATVGGALAFKAKKFADKNVYCATKDINNVVYCTFTDYKRIAGTPVEETTSRPCEAWHAELFGGSNALTTQYYTTTSILTPPNPRICGNPLAGTVYLTATE